eukprot:2858354-Alexandrium_andersonii.AAC.1
MAKAQTPVAWQAGPLGRTQLNQEAWLQECRMSPTKTCRAGCCSGKARCDRALRQRSLHATS